MTLLVKGEKALEVCIDRQCEPHIAFDEAAYLAFLQEQQIPDGDIAQLTVLLYPQLFTDAKYSGLYQHPKDARVITLLVPVWHSIEVSRLNRTLLHETRHLIQDAVFHEKDHEEQRKSLEWKDRPCEIDAVAFAAQHEEQHVFISAKVSPSIYVKASLRDWWIEGATHLWDLKQKTGPQFLVR